MCVVKVDTVELIVLGEVALNSTDTVDPFGTGTLAVVLVWTVDCVIIAKVESVEYRESIAVLGRMIDGIVAVVVEGVPENISASVELCARKYENNDRWREA